MKSNINNIEYTIFLAEHNFDVPKEIMVSTTPWYNKFNNKHNKKYK